MVGVEILDSLGGSTSANGKGTQTWLECTHHILGGGGGRAKVLDKLLLVDSVTAGHGGEAGVSRTRGAQAWRGVCRKSPGPDEVGEKMLNIRCEPCCKRQIFFCS